MRFKMNLKVVVSFLMIVSVVLSSCNSEDRNFVVEGKISNAVGQKLFLEEFGTGSVLSLDSIVIPNDGKYKLKHQWTDYPMLYRLRINSSFIPFTADSTNKHIIINSDNNNLLLSYKVDNESSENKTIQEICYLKFSYDKKVDSVLEAYTKGIINIEKARIDVDSVCNLFKSYLLKNVIYKNPKSPSSYYALFQRKGGATYFSADDPNDDKAFAAVATSYEAYYPSAPYTPFLKDLALKAIATSRLKKNIDNHSVISSKIDVKTVSFPEISGVDQRGNDISLTKLAKDNTVIVCFTSYSEDWSPLIVDKLRQIYKNNNGTKILDISIDRDYYYWKNAAIHLPWSSIQDINGTIFSTYNINNIPTVFIIKGGVISRFLL